MWWATEPDVGRVAHGVSQRVDRLRGLGNAVVPLQATVAFERLMGLENGNKLRSRAVVKANACWLDASYGSTAYYGYKEGFHKAMSLRATASLEAMWPSKDELFAAAPQAGNMQAQWEACYCWLKAKVLGEK